MSVNIEYRLIPCLKAGMQFSYGISNFEERVYFGEKSWYAANLKKNMLLILLIVAIFLDSEMPVGGELRLNSTKMRITVFGQIYHSINF